MTAPKDRYIYPGWLIGAASNDPGMTSSVGSRCITKPDLCHRGHPCFEKVAGATVARLTAHFSPFSERPPVGFSITCHP
jgi:hypothetical protein